MAIQSSARSGSIIAAVWLIGLGVVFLLQQTLELSWGEAWPMFVILAGIGSLVTTLLGLRYRRSWFAAFAWPVLLLVAGVLLLLSTTGVLGIGPGELVGRWWPLFVVGAGLWLLLSAVLPSRSLGSNLLELPLTGASGASGAAVKVSFGGGELQIGPGRPSMLTGEFEGVQARHAVSGSGEIQVEPESAVAWPWWEATPKWRIGLPTDIPVDLRVDFGAARVRLFLGDVQLRSLRIGTGASDTRVQLPRAAGETRVRAEGGAAALAFEVPAGVAARIHSRMALGSTRVDEQRFPRSGDVWQSPDYATSPNRVELEIQGGVGSVTVTGTA